MLRMANCTKITLQEVFSDKFRTFDQKKTDFFVGAAFLSKLLHNWPGVTATGEGKKV